jgi:parallel beta-helix repeat protein
MSTVTQSRVEDNEVFDNDGRGITIFNPDASEANRVERNAVHDNGGLGIWVSGRATSVTHNAVARNDQGIGLLGCMSCVAEGNEISGHDGGVLLGGTTGSRVVENAIRDNFYGIRIEGGGGGNVVTGNEISGNGVSGGFGVTMSSDGNRIVRNAVIDINGYGIAFGSGRHNLIGQNRIARVGTGISMGSEAHFNRVEGNSVTRSGTGMYVTSSDDNEIVANSFTRGLFGLSVNFSDRNLFDGNRIARNAHEGISLLEGNGEDRLLRNRVTNNGGDGILVEGTLGSVLDGNVTRRNADDGIDVEERSTTLARNRAVANGDLGIEAVAGVGDGGGNRASGNGNRLQCLNIACRVGGPG